MADHEIRTVRLDENEDFSDTHSYGQRIVTPIRFSTDPRDIGWVRENIPCQTACPADTNVPAYIRTIIEERYGRSYELNRLANVLLECLAGSAQGPVRQPAATAGRVMASRLPSVISNGSPPIISSWATALPKTSTPPPARPLPS